MEYINFFSADQYKGKEKLQEGGGGSFSISEYILFLIVGVYVLIHNKRIKFQELDFVNRVNHLITARLCHACLYSA